MRTHFPLEAAFVLVLFSSSAYAASSKCPALEAPPGSHRIVTVSTVSELSQAVSSSSSGTTILVTPGTYALSETLRFQNSNITLRSSTGNRADVVLDGGYRSGSIIEIYAERVTLADLTIMRAYYHPVHIQGGGHYATLYNLRIVDGREQFVKVNPSGGQYTDYGVLACSELELTPSGREQIHENGTPGFLCYTGGIDAHQSWGWTVRDNVFKSIYCTNGGLAEHAVHFWRTSRDTVVERNIILDCARGVGFGLGSDGNHRLYSPDPLAGSGVIAGHIGGMVRNNFIFSNIGEYYDSGVSLEQAWGAKVEHNTIYSAAGSYNVAIDARYSFTNAVLRNNLFYPRLSSRDGASPTSLGNVEAEASFFVNLNNGDLHLQQNASAVINKGNLTTEVSDDIDAGPRDSAPDVGADEYGSSDNNPPDPAPSIPQNLRFRGLGSVEK